MSLALVTGASSGIGAAFARALAAEGYDLVVVARDSQRLAEHGGELAAKHGVTVTPLPADLTTADGRAVVEQRLADPATPVDLLVNNAGMALNQSFLRSTPEDLDQLLALNIGAVQRLTRAALPGMIERGRGDVVNVSSVAGFMAMRGSTYAASKAWVTNFSESVGLAVRKRGVRVMALCPGFTRTEFQQRAGIDRGGVPRWLWLSADKVVRDGLRDLRRGRLVSVPDWRYRTAVFGLRYGPRGLIQRRAR
ncbi:MAG: SDR family NAD(P)-dependent oxidoreductase [Actinobacteria bacterium]|nr:MAG: SDR family NAD(P)-dependent oxidoreductase [Actinomycetota bacterium]